MAVGCLATLHRGRVEVIVVAEQGVYLWQAPLTVEWSIAANFLLSTIRREWKGPTLS